MNKKVVKVENPATDGFIGEMVEVVDEQISIRIVETDEGKKYNIVQVNPWQLWEIKPAKGETPEDLKDKRFTSSSKAEQDLERYLNKVATEKAKLAEAKAAEETAKKVEYAKMRMVEAKNDKIVEKMNAAR